MLFNCFVMQGVDKGLVIIKKSPYSNILKTYNSNAGLNVVRAL
jgi:hypothetical protein